MIFCINDIPYKLRHLQFKTNEPNYKIYGLNSVSYKCGQIWNSIPRAVRDSSTLNVFKTRIKDVEKINCNCDICTPYIQNIGYIQINNKQN